MNAMQQRDDLQSARVASFEQAYADALEKKILP